MGFSVKRINKYVRWVKNTANNYKTDKAKVGGKYASLCLKQNVALLLQKPAMIDKASQAKHEWVLAYMEKACAETVKTNKTRRSAKTLFLIICYFLFFFDLPACFSVTNACTGWWSESVFTSRSS